MMAGMVLFWGVVVAGVVWLVHEASGRRPTRCEESPLEILDRRFAEGALSVDEYDQRRGVLVGAPATEGAAR
jgi:putative membrane protein